jgi:hypothetical protein
MNNEEHTMRKRFVKPTQRGFLRAVAAMHFGVPKVCRKRECRRARGCLGRDTAGDPACIALLHASDRPGFQSLFELVEAIRDNTIGPYPSRDRERARLERMAIAVLDDALPHLPGVAKHFADWKSRYCGPPPPEIDAAALARQLRAELDLIIIRGP